MKPTPDEIQVMRYWSNRLGDPHGDIFMDMLKAYKSGRMSIDDIRNKAERELGISEYSYASKPKCASACGGYPTSCVGCNLEGNR